MKRIVWGKLLKSKEVKHYTKQKKQKIIPSKNFEWISGNKTSISLLYFHIRIVYL